MYINEYQYFDRSKSNEKHDMVLFINMCSKKFTASRLKSLLVQKSLLYRSKLNTG